MTAAVTDIFPLRPSARALVIHKDRVLCVQREDADGLLHQLPGGRIETGETLQQTAVRECFEETGLGVRASRLRFVHEFAGRSIATGQRIHGLEFIFDCTPTGTVPPEAPVAVAADARQVGVLWLPIDSLGAVRFYPVEIVEWLRDGGEGIRYFRTDWANTV